MSCGGQNEGRRSVGIMALAMAMLASLLVTLNAGVAGAAQDVGPGCQMTATADGFDIAWSGLSDESATSYVVERKVFNRYWWRTRTTDTTFSDGKAPRTSASVTYRVRTRSAAGLYGSWVDCDLVTTSGLTCSQTETAAGYEITIDGPVSIDDYVVRRQVTDGGAYFWRSRTTNTVVDDRPSPTGMANYVVWARTDKTIVGAANCGEQAPECRQSLTPDEVRALELSPAPADPAVLAPYGQLFPQGDIEASAVGPDGVVYFVRPDDPGQDYLYRIDPASGEAERWGVVGTTDFFPTQTIHGIDAIGGVTTSYSNNDGTYWQYSHSGETVTSAFDNPDGTKTVVYVDGHLPDGRIVRSLYGPNVQRVELYTPTGIGVDNGTSVELNIALDGPQLEGVTLEGELFLIDADGPYLTTIDCVS